MNILQLCDEMQETYLSYAMGENNRIITKYDLQSISYVSYDAFIITANFLELCTTEDIKQICSLNKPVVFVYNSDNKDSDEGMKTLQKMFNIKFVFSDCSVLQCEEWKYKPANIEDTSTYVMTSKNGEKYCFVKNTEKFLIYKKKNISIMHDLQIEYTNRHVYILGIYNLLKELFSITEETSTNISWLKSINILNDKELTKEKEKIQKEIEQLKIKLNNVDEEYKKNNKYKKVLYTSGDELVDIVEEILTEMLEIPINDIDRKKQDLYFCLNNVNVLVEVKGVNHPFKRENISQTKRHVTDYANENDIYGEDINKKCKGVLIMNPYSLHELKDKISKEFYSPEVISDAKYENICTLDTMTLLNYYSQWKINPKSKDLKDIILNKTYNEPDYDEIIEL